MNDKASPAPTNIVVLNGVVRGEPTRRELPSGSIVWQFDVATTSVDGRVSSVPVAWTDPSEAAVRPVTDGNAVVVIGGVCRRFFRVAGSTQSRTEVVADTVVPARRRRTVETALAAVAARLGG